MAGGLTNMPKKKHTNVLLEDAKALLEDEQKQTRVNFNVPADLLNAFKAKCYAGGDTMKTIVIGFMSQYLETGVHPNCSNWSSVESGFGRLNFNVPDDLIKRFKSTCYAKGVAMRAVVLSYIENYVKA